MRSKRVISILLLAVYLIATSANSLGILWCDCAAHHSHDLCCNHHNDHDHDHSLCAAFCTTEGCAEMLTQHCSCTHSHGESVPFTLSSDTDELLKYIKLFVGDAVYSFDIQIDSGTVGIAAVFRSGDDVPIVAPPVISTGAPRAPSFSA